MWYDKENITCSWRPDEKQWWITDFNPKHLRDEVDVKKQVMIGCVDFTGREFMYDSLRQEMIKPENEQKSKYAIFDDVNCIVWFLWYNKELI